MCYMVFVTCVIARVLKLCSSQIRLHAQALTLAALAGAAIVEYYDHKSGAKAERVVKLLDIDEHRPKN